VHELIQTQVRQTPDAVAVVFEGQTLTYRSWTPVPPAAHRLQQLGVGPEVLVGLCLERSLDMAVALVAVLKAGGAYVPLDPDYPRERLDFVVADSRPAVVLTTARLTDRFAVSDAAVVRLDEDRETIARHSASAPPARAHADNAVYVLYTSGSTGRPKGAVNHHRGHLQSPAVGAARDRLEATDRVLFKTPLSFDVSVEEFFTSLICGPVSYRQTGRAPGIGLLGTS